MNNKKSSKEKSFLKTSSDNESKKKANIIIKFIYENS